MVRSSHGSVLDRFLDPVAECLTPEVAQRIVALQPDPETQTQIDELAAKANEGTLSAEERTDYEDIVEGIDFIAILKAKARIILAKRTQ